MHNGRYNIAVTLAALSVLAGCAQTKGWLDRVTPGGSDRSSDPVILGAPDAKDYLKELERLATGDPRPWPPLACASSGVVLS